MPTPQQQIIDKCKEVYETATLLYGVDMSRVTIHFDLKGHNAGMACRRGAQYYMRFNRDMLTRDAFDHVLNNTVPHEIAHIVCFMKPQYGRNHDSGWERVCRALGGTGARAHTEEVVYGKGTTYEYVTSTGKTVRVGDRHHKVIQAGRSLTWKRGLGTVTNACQYSIVGVQGRTLANPRTIVPTVPAATPAYVPAYPFGVIGTQLQPKVPHTVEVPKRTPRTVAPTAPHFREGASKAAISRSIMLAGHTRGQTYEQIISAMMLANGYDRQLARATYKANFEKVGVPAPQ
jgi:predicted SprT family Zn-dependent metalloprotease